MDNIDTLYDKWCRANEDKASEVLAAIADLLLTDETFPRYTSHLNHDLNTLAICFTDGTVIQITVGDYEGDLDDDFAFKVEEYVDSHPKWKGILETLEEEPDGLLGALLDLDDNGPPEMRGGRP